MLTNEQVDEYNENGFTILDYKLSGDDLEDIKFVGYAFQIEMKFKAHLHKFKIIEVPIIFKDRELGKSKMSGKIINEAVFGVLSLKWNSLFRKTV